MSVRWPVAVMCVVLGASVSGLREHRRAKTEAGRVGAPGAPRLSDEAVVTHIRVIHAQVCHEYGWPRMAREMTARGHKVGKERVRLLMQRHGIKARGRRKFVVTTDSAHSLPIARNLLQRDFTAGEPNVKWTSDITYIATDEGWLYLAAIIDLHSRQVVGWSMHRLLGPGFVTSAGATNGWTATSSQDCSADSRRHLGAASSSSIAHARPRLAPTSSTCCRRCGRSRRIRRCRPPTMSPSAPSRHRAQAQDLRAHALTAGDHFLAHGFSVHGTCLRQGVEPWKFIHEAVVASMTPTQCRRGCLIPRPLARVPTG